MKTRITIFSLIACVSLLLVVMSGRTIPAAAQEPKPPHPTKLLPNSGPYHPPEGLWAIPKGAYPPMSTASVSSSQATGGPDDFGYTWDDSVSFDWIDATDGTDTGMSGSSWGQATTPVTLPFPFKYYENTYTHVYIAASGYLAFTDAHYWPDQQNPMPSIYPPNNVVSPYWTVIYLENTDPTGRVYYKSGGTTPNRYFVVEWYDVKGGTSSDSSGGDEIYRFEVVLFENGDILFQYHTMTYNDWRYYASIGIEDIDGNGLGYMDSSNYWSRLPSNHTAIRFYRPAPSARVSIKPLYQGHFAHTGSAESFYVPVRNTGELGNDTYDLSVSSLWPVGLYVADGTTPLTDTDGDGTVDTGIVAQGETVTVTVKISASAGATVGDDNSAAIMVRSSLDTGKSKMVTLQTAIPASFAQIYQDNDDGAMSFYLVQPGGQSAKKTTSDRYYGYNMAVAEIPNKNFIYMWSKGHCLDTSCNLYVNGIEYTIVDKYGDVVRPVNKLTDNSGATVDTYDYPTVTVAPNGRIGVVWVRTLWNHSTDQTNYNIYFAILDSSGNQVYGPVNLTNNTVWGTWSDLNMPFFSHPRIVATNDNRFVLAWHRGSQESESNGWVDDIYYTVRDTNGAEVKGITTFTSDTPGWDEGYDYPNLAQLSNNRVLLVWHRYYDGHIYYAVLDSAGNTVQGQTDTGSSGREPDAAQLSDGKIVVAWSNWDSENVFAVLNDTYNVVAGPTTLNNPAAVMGDEYVSVAADSTGHAILTWMDSDWNYRHNLYYALVDGNGNVLTDPMIFRTSHSTVPYISTSTEGYGNTSYSWMPPSGVDGVAAFSASLFNGYPGGNAAVGVRYTNHGATTATGVVLTATLNSTLIYMGDNSGVSPTVSDNDVIWSLPDIDLLESHDFTLYVRVPSTATIGSRYPITLTLTSTGAEANASDNTTHAEVMAARQVFLPLVCRGY